ncbi:MAG: peptide ABC transporter substrate-binding protein [Chlamydiales bacterium]
MQTLRLNFQAGDLHSLHPHFLENSLRGRTLGKSLFEGLTRINPEGKIELAGAESLEISPDKTQYTFVLRDQKWSNGSPVTAFQYEQAWKCAVAPNSSCARADLFYMIKHAKQVKMGNIELDKLGVKALNDKVLYVELDTPAPYFLEAVAQPIFAPLVGLEEEPTLFNGPYIVEKWERDNSLVLQASPFFWDKETVAIQRIEITMVTDAMSSFSIYEKGGIDWIGEPFSSLPLEVSISLLESKEQSLKKQEVMRPFWVFLNTDHPALSSSKIRQALSRAVDREAITKHVLVGKNPMYTPLPAALSQLKLAIPVDGKEEAKRLFKQGLEELDLTLEQFPRLTVSFTQGAGRRQFSEYLGEVWKETFGIEVGFQSLEWTTLHHYFEKGKYEIGGWCCSCFYGDPVELLERFENNHAYNFSNWVHPTYRKTIELAKKAHDQEKRDQLIAEAEKILFECTPFIPICNFVHYYMHHPKLKDFAFDCSGGVDFRWAYFDR